MSSYFYKSIVQICYGLVLLLNVSRLPQLSSAEDSSAYTFEANKIAVIGTGYVGLVLGAGLAEWGHQVICADILQEKITSLQNGELPFYEADLDVWVNANLSAKRLRFTTNIDEAVQNSDIIFVTVSTPSKSDGSADLFALESVAKTIAKNINGQKIVCIKSTVPIGTTRRIQTLIAENMNQNKFSCDVTFNPEFLREGSALADFIKTDRLVIGGDNPSAVKVIADIFHRLLSANTTLINTDLESAEAIKYASNAYLATKISFINEFANLCDVTGADIDTVAYGLGLDPRIGSAFLKPGPGYGGSCLPKDTLGLVYQAKELKVDLKIVQATIDANDAQINRVIIKLKQLLGEDLNNKKIAVLGLAFKANTDDIRCSPALTIIAQLLAENVHVTAYDPMAMNNMQKVLSGLDCCSSIDAATAGTDAVIVLTDWEEIKSLDLSRLRQLMKTPILIDTRNLYDPQKLDQLGFLFSNSGRPIKKH